MRPPLPLPWDVAPAPDDSGDLIIEYKGRPLATLHAFQMGEDLPAAASLVAHVGAMRKALQEVVDPRAVEGEHRRRIQRARALLFQIEELQQNIANARNKT